MKSDLSGATTDAELLALWLAQRPASTVAQYKPVAQAFLDARDVRTLTIGDVITWSETVEGKDATRARIIATIKSFLTFAWRTGYTEKNVGRMLKCVKVDDTLHERLVAPEDVAELIKYAQEGRNRTLVRLLYIGGVRISEACALRFVDIQPGRLTVRGKGRKVRTLLVPSTLTDELKALRGAQDGPQSVVFKSKRGQPLLVRNARQVVYDAAEAAGITLSPHWLRHGHASHALDNGAPLHVVRDSLGHANISTTSRYLHAKPNQGASQYLGMT